MTSQAPDPKTLPRRAMALAAGLGERLKPLTDRLPKPLIEVGGRTLIDHALDRLGEAGVASVVVNSHHKAKLLESHLAKRRDLEIHISREDELLDTGGGVAQALDMLGPEPFLVVNSDILWLNGPSDTLKGLVGGWDDGRMDAYLLLYPTVRVGFYDGAGDYFLDPLGKARRRADEIAPFLFTGIQLLHPRLFAQCPVAPFSLNRLYDRAEAEGRLFGRVHDGLWHHLGTKAGLAAAEQVFHNGRAR